MHDNYPPGITEEDIDTQFGDEPIKYKIIITVQRDDETEIERDYIYQKGKDYNKEVESMISSLEA